MFFLSEYYFKGPQTPRTYDYKYDTVDLLFAFFPKSPFFLLDIQYLSIKKYFKTK